MPEVVDPQGTQTQIGLGPFEGAAAEVGVAQHPATWGGDEELIRATTSDQLPLGARDAVVVSPDKSARL